MTFYSGFSLQQEEGFFADYHDRGDFCIAGFSLGAIKAFEYTLACKSRIDKLQLFSPAFFQESKESFKKVQLRHFQKDRKSYIKNFLTNCAYPSAVDLQSYYHDSPDEELQKLLYYVWEPEKLKTLVTRGIMIEVYLGEKDKIIDSQKAEIFFKAFTSTNMMKNRGHILQKEENG